jgi:predicted ATPase
VIISKVEATGYRCLRDVKQELQPYQILVGPNGSGKSVFLDVVGFLGDVVSGGLKEAVAKRTENFYDLVWGRKAGSFQLAIEASSARQDDSSVAIRYEIGANIDANDDVLAICREQLTVNGVPTITRSGKQICFFPESSDHQPVVSRMDSNYTGLNNLTGEQRFPTASRLLDLMREGLRRAVLDGDRLRAASPPGGGKSTVYDGSNLARLVAQLQAASGNPFESWVGHVQTAIPDIVDIRTILRQEDRHRYLMVQYAGGLEVPQWMLSDGTLRLLALTILAYLPDFHGVYLVEEPEIGLHPTAIETVMQSLSSFYDGQVLITSHSPLVLSLPRPDELLCFQKTENGTTIIPGNEHPMLSEWKSGVNISDLFAAGVLG